MAGKIIDTPELRGGFTVAGVTIVDADGNIDAPVTTTDLTTTGNTTLGNAVTDTTAINGATTITTTSASGLTVGRQGATAPVLKVDAATASVATGISVTGAAAAGGVAVAAISSGTNENLTIDAKGSGTVTVGSVSTGNVVVPRTFAQGTDATDRVAIKGIYMSPANVSVTIPSYAADTCDSVAVDVSGAFSMQPAVGDAVIAMPQEALPTNCVVTNAYVTATDQITVTFASAEAGAVTGAAKNFKFLVVDVT